MREQLFSRFIVLALVCSLFGCSSQPGDHSESVPFPYSESHLEFDKSGHTPECCVAKGKKIAIASGGANSSKAGLEIHKKGGNIVDVAVATLLCLAVERPYSAGLGGGGFMTLHLKDGKSQFIDFRESAPRASTRKMFLDKEGNPIPKASTVGGLAVATPGFVAGVYDIHKKWGKLPWKDVVAPSVQLATNGFALPPLFYGRIVSKREQLLGDPVIKSVLFNVGDEPLKAGAIFRQRDLGKTLAEIGKRGKAAFYSGDIAKRIVQTVKRSKGILSAEDLQNYQVKFHSPIRSLYKGYVLEMPLPPSAGGVLIAQMLNVLSGYDLEKEARDMGQYMNLMTEVMKRAYADRSLYIGDPAFFKANYQTIMSQEYADELRKSISADHRTPSEEIRPKGEVPKGHGTTTLSIIDDEGNAVASTISINTGFGATLGVPGTGIWLNNTMDDFSIKPGEQNTYGLTGSEGNAIAPGKRPVSSMTPTIVLDEVSQRPILAIGGAGGSKIITGVFSVLLKDLVHYKGDLKNAVFSPRIHHQWLPDATEVENGFNAEALQKLRDLGHKLEPPAWLNEIHAAQRDLTTGELTAVNDPRIDGGSEAK